MRKSGLDRREEEEGIRVEEEFVFPSLHLS